MIRPLLLIVTLLVALLGVPDVAMAADESSWPYTEVDDHFRGTGQYFSWFKLAITWLLFLAWVRSTDWVSRDTKIVTMRFKLWVPIVVGTFAASLALLWLGSSFALGFSLLCVAYVAPLGTYIGLRNRSLPADERVLTPAHLSEWFGDKLSAIGLGSKRDEIDEGPLHMVQLRARCSETEAANRAISSGVLTLPGYDATGELLGDTLAHRAHAAMMDVQAEIVTLRYMIDGVWHNVGERPKETIAPILDVVRSICTGDPTGQRATAYGCFEFVIREEEYVCQVTQQKTNGVYRVVLKLEEPVTPFDSLEALGMHPKMAEQLRARLGEQNHMIVLASLPGGGLSTTIDTILEGTDRIRNDCAVLESAAKYERDVDATEVHQYSADPNSTDQGPAAMLAEIVKSWPDVLVIRDLKDSETARLTCRQAKEDRVVLVSIAAKSAVEALLRVLMLKVPPAEFAGVTSCVVYQRLIRKLCDQCKESYQPSAKLLKSLGLPEDRVKAICRPPKAPEEVCPKCRGVGYHGRTALFEMLTVDDTVREVLTSKPTLDGLRAVAQQKGAHSVQEFGAVMIARGETSVEELSRILKQ